MSIIYDYEGVARALRKLQGKPEPKVEPDRSEQLAEAFMRRIWGTVNVANQEDDDA